MAWRVDEHVVRGEIDNPARGRVTGRIWFVGRAEPVELQLTGNCWRDLAGRRLEFVNPAPKSGLKGNLAARQVGVVGDITASRKVKVLDFPLEDMRLYYKTGREMPWHWGNSLYLEWFSERNGRVVIETASFELKVVGEPAWEMTATEEEEQRRANGAAMGGFMDRLGEVVAQSAESEENVRSEDPAGEEKAESGDDDAAFRSKPMTEAEAEEMHARSELLNDRIQARLDREGPDADYEKILEEEIERMNREDPAPEPTPEELAERAAWLEAFNSDALEAAQETELDEDDEDDERSFDHPVAQRAKELCGRWRELADAEGLVPDDAVPEHPVQELLHALARVDVKLAAWLNRREWPPELEFCAMTIVRLKQTREYLNDAVRALESCEEEKLLTPARLASTRSEVADLAGEVDELIAELRARLERGVE